MTAIPAVHHQPDSGWRRLAAGGVDYGIVAAYLGVLGLVGALGQAAAWSRPTSRPL